MGKAAHAKLDAAIRLEKKNMGPLTAAAAFGRADAMLELLAPTLESDQHKALVLQNLQGLLTDHIAQLQQPAQGPDSSGPQGSRRGQPPPAQGGTWGRQYGTVKGTVRGQAGASGTAPQTPTAETSRPTEHLASASAVTTKVNEHFSAFIEAEGKAEKKERQDVLRQRVENEKEVLERAKAAAEIEEERRVEQQQETLRMLREQEPEVAPMTRKARRGSHAPPPLGIFSSIGGKMEDEDLVKVYEATIRSVLAPLQNTENRKAAQHTLEITGYLTKRGKDKDNKWNKRFFALTGDTLFYQTKEGEIRTPSADKRIIPLTPDMQVLSGQSKEKDKKFYFDLVSNDRTLHLFAETQQDRTRWVDALRKNIEYLALHTDKTPEYDREQLWRLLRHALHVSLPQHETIMISMIQDSTPIQRMKEELELRLKHVDTHHFYRPTSFKNREAFDSWKQKEVSQIRRLMEKMEAEAKQAAKVEKSASVRPSTSSTHLSIPAATQPPSSSLLDYNLAYSELLYGLIRVESPESRLGQMEGPHVMSPLSSRSLWILNQFATTYGVGQVYTELSMLELFSTYFEHTATHINVILSSLYRLAQILSTHPPDLTLEETTLLSHTLASLISQAHHRLVAFKVCFPVHDNSLAENLHALTQLLILVSRAAETIREDIIFIRENYNGNLPQKIVDDARVHKNGIDIVTLNAHEMIKQAIFTAVHKRFHEFSMVVDYEEEQSGTASAVSAVEAFQTPRHLRSLCDMIIADLRSDVHSYHNTEFSKVVDYMGLVVRFFRDELWQNVVEFSDHYKWADDDGDLTDTSLTVGADIFTLTAKLRNVSEEMVRLADVEPLPLPTVFSRFVLRWLDETRGVLRKWSNEMVVLDKWLPISDTVLYSSSVVDLFSMMVAPLAVLQNLLYLQPADGEFTFFGIMQDIISQALSSYARNILSSALKEFPEELHPAGAQEFVLSGSFTKKKGSTNRRLSTIVQKKDVEKDKKEKDKKKEKKEKTSFLQQLRGSKERRPSGSAAPLSAVPLTVQMCVRVNNLETSRYHLESVSTDYNMDMDDDSMIESLRALKQATTMLFTLYSNSLGLMLEGTLTQLHSDVTKLEAIKRAELDQPTLEKTVEARLTSLLKQWDDTLQMVVSTFLPDLTVRFLRSLWAAVIHTLEYAFVPPPEQLSSVSHCNALEIARDHLATFFPL
eukprot:TRINITY_DN2792_c0_g1_i6.p1 TRINITY_DN2792_c0_g1~~TRINITY_DN2792_c0_g1_i6.p1  ORF type:complete len:1211 (-),score=344.33 TRINITY_DN2792_c0_g1_i6:74-3637(-)